MGCVYGTVCDISRAMGLFMELHIVSGACYDD